MFGRPENVALLLQTGSSFKKFSLDEPKHKPNKIWLDKISEFSNRSTKLFLQSNDIEMHSKHNKGKSVVAEIFIRTLKNKIHKYMILIS